MGDGLFAGRYELAELLGSGGMARVHRARDTRMGRIVAIKTLMPELALDADARRRFAREAHAAGSLNHPGIVTVHDQDEVRDGDTVVPYLVMEYVRGGTLSQLVREQAPFEPERAVRITCDILDALAHAHAHGTVHRDVKPANVMITDEGAVKVTDFGIARVLDTDTRLTTAGSSIGTPSYMSPEQINGADVDARSDIYAVGCVLTELLTGKPPFHDGNPLNLMYWHVHSAPPVPSSRNPRVPRELDALVLAAMAKNPADRPADAGVYRTQLWAWLTAARSHTLTGPATVPPVGRTAPAPAADPRQDPRTTFGVGSALPALPAQGQGPAQVPLQKSPVDSTPPPSTPPPAEHPAYSRNRQVPLPPPYLPSTPPPVNLGAPGPNGTGANGGRWTTRRKVLTGVSAVAFAGIVVSVVLATGALGNKHHKPTPGPTNSGHTSSVVQSALQLHGGTEGSGYNGGISGVVRPSTHKGGTVHLAASYLDADLLDPANTYTVPAWNIQRLIMRKLVDYAPAPGGKGNKLEPDLATNTGDVSSDGLTWTFHLKSGVKFQDGTEITSKDVKYGIERTFDRDVHGVGPTYFADLLDEGQSYPGPYEDTDPDKMGLRSVATPDDRTIVFTLAKPYADFRYVLALSIGAPVPPSADTGDGKDYETHPVASGPYKVDSYVPGKSLRLVRNSEWSRSTDTIHSQLPDAYEVKTYTTQDEVEQALLDGSADLDLLGSSLSNATETKIVDQASLKADADLTYTGATRYLSLRSDVKPFDNADCRKAVEYAVDRAQVKTALGGQYSGGEVASTMLPPTNDSYDPAAQLYSDTSGSPETGEAESSLAACGKPDGFSVTMAASKGTTRVDDVIQSLRTSLKAVGINVRVVTLDTTVFYDTLLSPSKLKSAKWGMTLTSWAGDWPTGGGFLRSLIQPGDINNYAGFDDSTVNGMVDAADADTSPAKAADAWKKIDAKVMQDAVLVPLSYDRHLIYRGSRLTNVYQQQVLGMVDLTALGVTA